MLNSITDAVTHESVIKFQDSTVRIAFMLPVLPANLQNHLQNYMCRLPLAGSFHPSKYESALEVFYLLGSPYESVQPV